MNYKFRLTCHHFKPGFFRFGEKSLAFFLDEETEIIIEPRDTDELKSATQYHFDCGGFPSETAARQIGEKLRSRLRIVNCILGLGLTVPIIDGSSGSVSTAIKETIKDEGNGTLLDTIVGLAIYPNDGNHVEHVCSARLNTYPSDPHYVLTALKDLWHKEINYDEQANDAFEILSIAGNELSPKTKFLTTYLAIERLIESKPRSEEANNLIDSFIEQLRKSDLEEKQADSLISSIGNLKQESFSSAFSNLAKQITSPAEIAGMQIQKFVSKCISIRNKIAHNANLDPSIDLNIFTNGLREFALTLIWTKNNIPKISIQVPADTLEMEKFEIRMM